MPRRDDYDDDDRYRDDRRDDRRRDFDDEGYDDYEYDDRPRRGSRRAALERVSLPAIFLMIVGGLGLGLAVLNAIIVLSGVNDDKPNPFMQQNANMKNDPGFIAGKVSVVVVTLVWGPLVFLGGLQMKNLKSRGFVLFSSILAMLPCNWCCLLGIPFGIWALVVINDENVRRAFARSSY